MSESTEETEEKLKLEIDKEIEKLKYYLEQADDIIKEGDFGEIEVINKRTETPRAETWSGNSQSDISMEKGYKGKVHSIGPTMFAILCILVLQTPWQPFETSVPPNRLDYR